MYVKIGKMTYKKGQTEYLEKLLDLYIMIDVKC
jgi:hypothetical protein